VTTDALSDREVRNRVGRVEAQLAALERIEDERIRATALEAVQGLVDLYGETLGRIIRHVSETCGADAVEALAADELVDHMLLLHDLHPLAVEDRVRQALEEVRPYLRSHGGNVELLSVEAGVARVRFDGSCHGCASSAATLRDAIEQAVRDAAPELEEVVAESEPSGKPAPPVLVQLGMGERSAPVGGVT
jgi:Fe-S cluster biogenesis protein NfuA